MSILTGYDFILDKEKPVIYEEIRLPDAVDGQTYYTEIELPHDANWSSTSIMEVFPNRYATIEMKQTISSRLATHQLTMMMKKYGYCAIFAYIQWWW
ncbi:hypothetical protein [Faucicola boevrei]|uniref:hypothetical protein n=1 Tax=Faucicola boevrei TaxID=346665 RepID=UPI0003A8DC6D|nr:hypothetical protein [Moraxella boevrei]